VTVPTVCHGIGSMPIVIDKRAMLGGVLIAGTLVMAGCTSEDGAAGGMTLDGARRVAVNAGSSPASCPIPFDVSAALPGGPRVEPGEVEVQVSKTSTPAPDPIAAQVGQGMSAIDAAAGMSINCDYQVDGKTVGTWLVATPGRGSINIMAPVIASAGEMEPATVTDFVTHPPEPGEVKLTPGGKVAVATVHVQGAGNATLMVNPDGIVTGEALSKSTKTLLGQVHL
jgi:hypothetical protein